MKGRPDRHRLKATRKPPANRVWCKGVDSWMHEKQCEARCGADACYEYLKFIERRIDNGKKG